MKCTEIRAAMLVIFAVLMSFAAGVTDSVSAQTPRESVIVIINARVIDGTGAPARADQTIVIRGKHISSITPGGGVPPGARVFDAKGMSVLPGIVAMHDHLQDPYQDSRMYLAHGVTTVRVAGTAEPYTALNLRRWISELGILPGPELFVASPWLNRHTPEMMRGPFIMTKHVRDAEDARRAVRYWAAEGVTAIKVYAGITPDLMTAIIDEARKNKLPVLGHLKLTSCTEAAKAGIAFIEHGFRDGCLSDLRDAGGKATRDPHNPLVATLIKTLISAGTAVTETPVDKSPFSASQIALLHAGARAEYLERMQKGNTGLGVVPTNTAQGTPGLTAAFAAAGGLVVLGADGSTRTFRLPGIANLRAVRLMYTEFGFTQLESIRIATLNGARGLKIADRTGSVAVGKEADLLIVRGDPSTNIHDIQNVEMVFSDGLMYKPDELLAPVKGNLGWRR